MTFTISKDISITDNNHIKYIYHIKVIALMCTNITYILFRNISLPQKTCLLYNFFMDSPNTYVYIYIYYVGQSMLNSFLYSMLYYF